jgi:hypothetical protein
MSDLIDRQAAIDALGEIHTLDYNAQSIKARLEKLPTIEAEPVVRCKDCEHWDTEWTPECAKDEPMECHWCNYIDLITDEDFFCAYGEVDDGTD